jgi:hypothetical protein
MNLKCRRRQTGYSLAELLTAVAVFSVVMIAALLIYDRSNKYFKEGIESSNLQQNTRVAFDKLVADLRMTGFDFDRDGIPSGTIAGGTNQYQQPDEQFEYVSPSAITIRGNFDYERETQPCSPTVTENCDHGREGSTYESSYFPVVTTGNDEIVTYALVPDSQTTIPACNPLTNCVEFYADTHVPRRSYPEPGAATPGLSETLVQIPGVDLCVGGCNNPPYTLYRFTLRRDQSNFTGGVNVNRIPIASNIRSMSFTYFQDAQGSDPLKDLENTTDVDIFEIRGLGQFNVNDPSALINEREIRSKIRSVLVDLVGMNENIDRSYTEPTDTVAPNYRQYRLQTLVSPRNIQRRGMREQDIHEPGAPSIRTICTGHCGGVYLEWNAPEVSANQGAPDQYKVIYGPTAGVGYPCETTTFTQTYTHVFGTGDCALKPDDEYRFAVVALNSYGSSQSHPPVDATPLNATKPNPPVLVSATNNQSGKVTLVWNRPTTNASGGPTCGPVHIPPAEIMGYRVERATSDSGPWEMIGSGPITMSSPANVVTWTDTTAANCIPYWYRVMTVEKCSLNGAWNVSGIAEDGSSTFSTAIYGEAASGAKPKTPDEFDVDSGTHNCDVALNCEAHMSWSKVIEDEEGAPLNIAEYKVYHRPLGTTAWQYTGSQTVIPAAGDTVSYESPGLPTVAADGSQQQYEFTVAANQCSSLESDTFTPVRLWPCTFPEGIVASPMLTHGGAFDGDGTATNPWSFFNSDHTATVSVNILDPSRVQSITARVYNANGTIKANPAISGDTFSWTMGTNVFERIVVTVTESGGCTRSAIAWVRDMPQNCCLAPLSFDNTVVAFTPGNRFVDIYLKNLCAENLSLFSYLSITWQASRGGDKLESVRFTAPNGTTVTHTVPNNQQNNATVLVPIPISTGTSPPAIPAGSSTYAIRVTFGRAPSSSPVVNMNVTYRRVVSDLSDVSCDVIP